ncbi:MAG: acyl-phosphate glycerol 3-phosphate acyltransferase, partial [Candidatus Melainabacteria bacterium HGW-Melainabacteria-1]
MNVPGILLGLVAAYLIGSFPTGLIVGRLFYKKDPREAGSG